jgi:hypothetical protein
MFLCPITQDVMAEPVLAADGYTYDKHAIQVGCISLVAQLLRGLRDFGCQLLYLS